MSTYYHDLKNSWSRLDVDKSPERYVITLWDSQMVRAGALTLTVEDDREAIFIFFREEPAYQISVDGRGPVLREFRKVSTPTLLGEYGEIVTLDEIENECYRRDSEIPTSVLNTPA